MVSPTEGEVMEINPEIVKNPALLRQDPYGKGWLVSVHVPDEESTGRNLVPTALVHGWMREAAERLYALQPRLAGAVAADGGRPADDLLRALPDVNWKQVTSGFFLTA
jgi:glycine cleavage system H protein